MDPIQGGVSHNERGGFWRKAGDILGNIGEAVLDVAVPIGAAMTSSLVRPVVGGGFNNVGYDDYGQWESDPYPFPAQLDAQFQQEQANRRSRWDNLINQPAQPLLASQYDLNRPSQPLPDFDQPLPQTNLQGWANRQQQFWNNQNTQPQQPQQQPIELASNSKSLNRWQSVVNPQAKQREWIQEKPIDTPYRRMNRLREQSNYRHNGVQRNALDDFEQGQRLNEQSLKQLHHAVNLLAHQAQQNQREQAAIKKLRDDGLTQLAQADLQRHLQTTKQDSSKGEFTYKGQTFDLQDGVQVMLAEHQHFAEKDRFMNNAEIKALKGEIDFDKGTIAGAAAPISDTPMGFLAFAQLDSKLASKLEGQIPLLERLNRERAKARKLYQHMDLDAFKPFDITEMLNTEAQLINTIQKNYQGENDKIYWKDAPNIIDLVANNTKSDDEFKTQLWLLFGVNSSSYLNQYFDSENIGLPQKYHNSGVSQEQLHHYLGGVTGDFGDSHLLNNPIFSSLKEGQEFLKRGHWNHGDIRLFNDSRKHRDDFVRGYPNGRFTVGPNLRKLLNLK